MPNRTYGDVGSGGGYAPPMAAPPPAKTPDQLVPPLAAGAVQPYLPGQHIGPPGVGPSGVIPGPAQAPPGPQGDFFSQLFGWLGGTGMLGNQLAAQQAQPQPNDQGGPPFLWQRPAWQREGYDSEQAYNADLNRGY